MVKILTPKIKRNKYNKFHWMIISSIIKKPPTLKNLENREEGSESNLERETPLLEAAQRGSQHNVLQLVLQLFPQHFFLLLLMLDPGDPNIKSHGIKLEVLKQCLRRQRNNVSIFSSVICSSKYVQCLQVEWVCLAVVCVGNITFNMK